jgi:protein-tyrosine-phosphatase
MRNSESSAEPTTIRLLFVCTGNTCRSPMAQVLALGRGLTSGGVRIEARSAGTHARNGLPASEGARLAALRHGYSLETHESSELSEELVEWADWVLAMTPSHLHQVHLLGGQSKAELLGSYGAVAENAEREEGGIPPSVPDPFGGDDQVYEEAFLVLEDYVHAAVERLLKEIAG